VTGQVSSVRFAARMRAIAPFHVVEILTRAKALEGQGRSIVHMEIGEPDFDTPAPVLDAAQRALTEQPMHYTQALGIPELRAAIAEFYRTRYGIAVEPERVIVTCGSSAALLLALGVLVDPGARVLLSDPGYPANRHFVRALDGEPIGIPVAPQSAYQLSADDILANWDAQTVAALIASPSNPTGTLISHERLAAIHGIVSSRGGTLLVDEIYHGLTYSGTPRTALEIADDIVVINSFSKYFSMTGWRIGWLVAPLAMVRAIECLAQNLFISPPTLAQHAALAAFAPKTIAILEQRREAFRERRDFLIPRLRGLGFEISAVPEGAFYVYASCRKLASDSFEFCRQLLEQAGVAITPGIDFGQYRAKEHLRFAYTTSIEQLGAGIARIEGFLQNR
jgi:aspartate/methionine/tyrosine aminotransferase